MTNFEKFLQNLTLDKFIDLMLYNCDSCPNYPCIASTSEESIQTYHECTRSLRNWCLQEIGE